MVWGGRWEGGSGLGTHVHLWLIHVNVWQNQYSIVKQDKVKIKIKKKNKIKLNIQKTKIMASGPITSWEIDEETVETVSDFIWGGLQNHCRL